ncbi:MAG: hypothetical protein PHV30_04295 [Candidatus Margulisbacteria bacterium]|nr:hypothetical protein [Candidatus Margulisiibacteriota bacterium]
MAQQEISSGKNSSGLTKFFLLVFGLLSIGYWIKCFLSIDLVKQHHLSGLPYFHQLCQSALKAHNALATWLSVKF